MIKGTVARLRHFMVEALHSRQTDLLMLLGKLNIERIKDLREVSSLREVEFKVFSQWGEDGIIQYLTWKLPIPNKTFVEFGVETYVESNTRFLLMNDNWRGLVMDGSQRNVDAIRMDPIYWRHDLTAVASFITRDNINQLISSYVDDDDIGLLSVDIDGNDYWVWKEITAVNPRIVICEYNSVFGAERAVTIPYQEDFHRTRAHYSNLYWGASLAALCKLAEEKNYQFVGSNSAGNNAFFVRKDLSSDLPNLSPKEGYVQSQFREARDERGRLTYLAGQDRLREIRDMSVCDFDSGKIVSIKDLYD
jgi:hypothetical protein